MKIVVWEERAESGQSTFVAGHAKKKLTANGPNAKAAAGSLIAWLKESERGGVVPPIDFAHLMAPFDPDYQVESTRMKNADDYAAAVKDPVAYLRSVPELAASYEREGATDEEIRSRIVLPPPRAIYEDADERVRAMFEGGEPLEHPRLPKGWTLRLWRGDSSKLPPWPVADAEVR